MYATTPNYHLWLRNFATRIALPYPEFPRRRQLVGFSPAENSIREAINYVEAMGASPELTAIVQQLSNAKEKVADIVDADLKKLKADLEAGDGAVRNAVGGTIFPPVPETSIKPRTQRPSPKGD